MRKYLFSDINNLLFYIPQIIYLYFANPATNSKPAPLQSAAGRPKVCWDGLVLATDQ
jgi:hypothetical protein